ncbi:XdhC family protein [Pseudomonas entomophila]|uniref:XdhC family protein n=1 Tax=Pseudomonas entomophila TaxID=312306 RepID=UPI0023D7B8B9|nr:XdhC family protein [Pseudomonas entomophila]MDF0731582.1 XdhC family protein [Pseudomonas entomophila]
MRHLDLQVIDKALEWARAGHALWLCTVLSTYGSAPRSPGAMLVSRGGEGYVGSLSGGCVEEEFLESLGRGEFSAAAQVVRYGDGQEHSRRLRLPCGGVLVVLVEHRAPSDAWLAHLEALRGALHGQQRVTRRVALADGALRLDAASPQGSARVCQQQDAVHIDIGPALRLVLAGLSPVAEACADIARTLGCEVIACDPREEMAHVRLAGVQMHRVLPSMFIAAGGCHAATAVVALTHDPKIDDLALLEAVNTPAFYIGAMGSSTTSARRAERLRRIGGLSEEQIERLHMPIGLDLGSKSPAEIALAVMADVLRVYRGKARHAL